MFIAVALLSARPRKAQPPLLMLVILLALTPPALGDDAQSAPDAGDPRIAGILAELGSDDYATRVRATARLLADDELESSRLAELYAAAETLEQRHRLIDVARHHTIRRMRQRIFERADERGSLGVNFALIRPADLPRLERSAIMVVRPLAGFPAYPHLQPGDLIVGVNGNPMPRHMMTEDFRDMIQRHPRGERITLTIDREGERLEKRIALASIQALNSVYFHSPAHMQPRLSPIFREAWESAREQLVAHGPTPQALRVTTARTDEAD